MFNWSRYRLLDGRESRSRLPFSEQDRLSTVSLSVTLSPIERWPRAITVRLESYDDDGAGEGGLRQKASATVINFNGIVARARVPRRGTHKRTQESGHERMRGMMAPRARIFIFIFRLSLARARRASSCRCSRTAHLSARHSALADPGNELK